MRANVLITLVIAVLFFGAIRALVYKTPLSIFITTLIVIPFASHLAAMHLDANWMLADSVRWTGMIYQLAGIFFIVLRLQKSLKSSGVAGVITRFLNWFKEIRFLFVQRPPISGTSHMMEQGVGKFRTYGFGEFRTSGTTEEQIQQMQQKIQSIQSEISRVWPRLDTLEDTFINSIEAEQQERRTEDDRIRRQINEATVGHLHIDLSGVFFLALGVILSTAPNEIATGLHLIAKVAA